MTPHAAGHTRPLDERLSTRTVNPKGDSAALRNAAEAAAGQAPELRATLTVASTAERLGVSPWLLRRLVASGDLPAARLGRHIAISWARLLAWLDNQQEPPSPGYRVSTVSPARVCVPPRRTTEAILEAPMVTPATAASSTAKELAGRGALIVLVTEAGRPARTLPSGSGAGWRMPAGRLRTAPNWPGPRASRLTA